MKKKLNSVLLIDDDEPTNFLSRIIIEESECTKQIHIEESGEAALNYLRGIEDHDVKNTPPCPDIIFLDINMPAMNGWEFLTKYSELEQAHKGRIILVMLTTSLNPYDKLRAKEIPGISGFESKPLTTKSLDEILRKYFADHF